MLSLFAFCSTSAGGLLALTLRDQLRVILAFTASMLLAVVSFELLPEAFELSRSLGGDGVSVLVALVGGFLLFHGLRRHEHPDPRAGVMTAAALVSHSLMDGVGIGLAFQVSPAMGVAVAIAVIAHDFCDGLNTMSVMLMHGNPAARALGMLALDAAAPVLGAVSTRWLSVPPEALVVYLASFAGFLLGLAFTDILPRACASPHGAAAQRKG